MPREEVAKGLGLIFHGIAILQRAFSNRKFTIDGRLVGDIGEIIAAAEFDITLDERSRAHHDGVTSSGRRVQIKATFKRHLAFKSIPDYYLGLKLEPDGSHEVVFNGPGKIISDYFASRQGLGDKLLSFPVAKLRELDKTVQDDDRIPKRLA